MAHRKFVLVVEGEICGYLRFEDSFVKNANLPDELSNNPIIIEVPVDSEVNRGYKYLNGIFTNIE